MFKKGMVVSRVVGWVIFVAILIILILIITGTGDVLSDISDKLNIGSFKELFS